MGKLLALRFQPDIFWRLSCTEIKESPGFFLVERGLLSNALPKRALSIPAFTCYILHCRRAGGWNKVSLSFTNDLMRNGGIQGPKIREAAIEALKDKHFIEELPRKNGVRRFMVKGVPLYNFETNTYIPSPYTRNIKDMKDQNNGYIQVPSSLVDEGILRNLNGRETKVLLKLYQYMLTPA